MGEVSVVTFLYVMSGSHQLSYYAPAEPSIQHSPFDRTDLLNDPEIRAVGALRLYQHTGQTKWAALARQSAIEGNLNDILEELEEGHANRQHRN